MYQLYVSYYTYICNSWVIDIIYMENSLKIYNLVYVNYIFIIVIYEADYICIVKT